MPPAPDSRFVGIAYISQERLKIYRDNFYANVFLSLAFISCLVLLIVVSFLHFLCKNNLNSTYVSYANATFF